MHVTDDRGRRVRLIPQRQLGTLPGVSSPIPLDVRARIVGEAQSLQWSRAFLPRMGLVLLILLAWGAAWVVVSARFMVSVPLPPMVKGATVALVPVLPLPPLMWWLVRSVRQRVARLVVNERYCATCGYPLGQINAAADGCTVCPECGSAWRVGPPPDR